MRARAPRQEPETCDIPGLTLRGYRDQSDCQGIYEAMARSLQADFPGDEVWVSLEGVTRRHSEPTPRWDPSRDCVLAAVDGEIVGYGRVTWYQELSDKRLYSIVAFLSPEWRGRGLWRTMLRACETRAGEIAATHPAGVRRILQAWGSEPEVDWPALLLSEGYREVRHFWDMIRPIGADLPDVRLPAGLEVRPVRPEHLRAIWEAQREVAPDHWQYIEDDWTEGKFEEWREANVSGTALWQVAWDGSEVAGMVLASIDEEANNKLGRKRGNTEHVFVRRLWRRRGLAAALIGRALAALKAEGMDEAYLGVDEENPSGAMGHYRRLGYEARRQDTWYRKWLVRPAGEDESGLL